MKSHARVVVIGGGVVGCSVLYHLTKLGWKDVVLVERKELTSGSSWHAAGGFHALNSDPNVARLQAYTISVYKEIEEISGHNVGLQFSGGLNVAATKERWDFLKADWARHRVLGMDTHLVSPAEVKDFCPLMDVSEILGAIYDPNEGRLDPSGATHAFAKAARVQGAEVYRHTRVTSLSQRASGEWEVATDQGTIVAEHVVNAGGLWAREVGKMVGVDLPVVAMEHHYLLTDEIPELKNKPTGKPMPLVLDLDGEIYLMQERTGVLLGVYEKEATPWAVNGAPWEYGETELLPPDLERLAESLEKGFRRFPSLSNAGIRRVINGPFTFSPDGNPLVGPVPGLRNYWAACGVMAGFAQGGGVGLAIAEWMIHGQTSSDIYAMDVARFGPYATRPYAIAKAREFYARRFQIAYPNEYWPAGRPNKTSAIHTSLREKGAVFGVSYGMEVPLFFARKGEMAAETPTLRRSNAFDIVAEECRSSRERAGILDISSFAKYRVHGPSAASRLNRLVASALPSVGRVRLTPILGHNGTLMGDLTTLRLDDDDFLVCGSGYLQAWHGRWFSENLADANCRVDNLTDQFGGLAVFGPEARRLLEIAGIDGGNLPFMSVRRTSAGFAPAIVARMSVTGELGFEIYVPTVHLQNLYDRVSTAAEVVGARQVGIYALNSLRLEKSFGIWSREYSRDYTPRMAALERFIAYEKADFIGRDAALRDRETTPKHRLVALAIEVSDADASGYEPIYRGDEYVGFVTSGGFGHCAGKSLAMAYVGSAVPDGSDGLTVTIVGQPRTATMLLEPAIDPTGSRMRA